MADPIRKLLGVELDSPNIIPEQQAPPPPPNVAPPLPVPMPVDAGTPPVPMDPTQDTQPTIPLNVSTLTPQTPLQLPSPVVYGSDGVAPVAVTGQQQALSVLAPIAQKSVANQRFEQAESTAFSLSPNALPPTSQWEPPDLDSTISNYGANMAVLRQSFAAQTAARQSADERAWLERNMARIEAMNNPKSSPTADAFGWVGEMLGTSEDGSRTYVGAATLDKKSGEWKGSPVGAVLYGLGVLQNSAMGAIIDTKNMFKNVDKGLKSAYDTFTPPWMRGTLDPALNTLGKVLGHISPVVGMYQAATSGPTVSGPLTYNDGKSNFLEALRGAQFSFSDKASKGGLGLDYNKGLRVPVPGTKGFDLNYGVVAGLGLDILLGGKVDKVAGAALRKMGYSGTWTRAGAKKLAEEATAKATVKAAATPESVFKYAQLEIPFSSGPVPTNKVPRPKAAPKARPPVKGDVQQVLQIDDMMKEFGEADRLTNPLAYKKGMGGDGQLALRLGKIDYTPIVRNPPLKTPKLSSPGKQLRLNFSDLPEALVPKAPRAAKPITELLELADDVPLESLTPASRGEVLNVMSSKLKNQIGENQVRMSIEPDIGRRPILSTETVPIKPYVASDKWQRLELIDLPVEPLIHGTRVDNLVLSLADPSQGSALNELGAGHYLSTSRDVAELATKAAAGEGLPSVAGRSFMGEGEGAIHSVQIRPDARIMDANDKSWALETIVNNVAKNFPGLKDRVVAVTPRSYVQLIDDMVALETSGSARLQFQHELTRALRAEGIDGVRGADNIAIFNQEVIQTTNVERVTHLGMSPDDAYDARYQLDDWGYYQNSSELANANALDAETVALNQRLNLIEEQRRVAAKETWQNIQYAGLMDHPTRQPSLEEYSKLVVDDMFSLPDGNLFGSDPSISAEIGENVKRAIKNRGITLGEITDPAFIDSARGLWQRTTNTIELNAKLGVDDLTNVNNLKTLIHEMSHADIERIVQYSGRGISNNEAIVDSVASAVISILDPSLALNRKLRFDGFFEYINNEYSYYMKHGGVNVTPQEVRKQYGELVTKMVRDVVEEVAPEGFKVPTLDTLRIFGPESYEPFAIAKYNSYSSIEAAFAGSLTSIDEGLSIASKVDILATNPVSGKLNTRVRDSLLDSFDIDISSTVDQVNPLIEKWAKGLVTSMSGPFPAKAKKAQAVLDMISRGDGTADDYIAALTKLDKPGAKQYVPAIEKGVADAKVRKYC